MTTIPQTISTSDILILDRDRRDYGDITDFANEIKEIGLINPITLAPEKDDKYRLVAGGRRLTALKSLGITTLYHGITYDTTRYGFLLGSEIDEDVIKELELKENVSRKNYSWKEECINITKIHKLRAKKAALDSQPWGFKETGKLLGLKSGGHVHYCKTLADALLIDSPQDKELWACESAADGYRLLMKRTEDIGLAILAQNHAKQAVQSLVLPKSVEQHPQVKLEDIDLGDNIVVPEEYIEGVLGDEPKTQTQENIAAILTENDYTGILTLTKQDCQEYFSKLPNTILPFETWYTNAYSRAEKKRNHRLTIDLSSRFYFTDSIDFMLANPARFDHIITDIPYGIDMDMLDQENQSMTDISDVTNEHDVEENQVLYKRFFPAAFSTLKESGFLITWCDQAQWQLMYDLSIQAGFKTQRWPIVWLKTHPCRNSSAQYNFTKTTEIAMVCRKGAATIVERNSPSHIVASHDELKDILGHPFVKPFKVWEHLVKAVSIEGQLILEPFMGRGSGIISMLRMNRNVIGCEKNIKHYNACLENLKQEYLSINPQFKFK